MFCDLERVLQLLRFSPRSTELTLPPGPCVIIANHPTLVDVTGLVIYFTVATTVLSGRLL